MTRLAILVLWLPAVTVLGVLGATEDTPKQLTQEERKELEAKWKELAAAATKGLPPKVDAWSPGSKASATDSLAMRAPIGSPEANALASAITSGSTP